MSNVGIPMWVFQLQPRNSEARELTIIEKKRVTGFQLKLEVQEIKRDKSFTIEICGGSQIPTEFLTINCKNVN